MYSPKIKEEFIPVLYRLAKEQKVSMTKLVNDLVASGIKRLERRKSHEQRNGEGSAAREVGSNAAGKHR